VRRAATASLGIVEVHRVIRAVVTRMVGVTVAGSISSTAAHDSIVILVGKVPDVVPCHVGGNVSYKEFFDLVFQARGKIIAKVSSITIRKVSDDALELIGISFDRGGLMKALEVVTGFGLGVRVAKLG
jgi:hypothetical protein